MSVTQIADKINEGVGAGQKKMAFTSMDALMAGIKRDNSADIKTITSVYDGGLQLKIEGFYH
mgnify:CR=1 FL=1